MNGRYGTHWRDSLLTFSAALGLAVVGCGPGEPQPQVTDSNKLRNILRTYVIAARDLGRPPKSLEELEAVLAPAVNGDPSHFFLSDRDGQPYVVVWGLDLMRAPPETIVAYEHEGRDGKRLVVNADGVIREVTPEEFADLEFPEDHTAK